MLFAKIIGFFGAFCLIGADLLDLYVQHMDETMRTMAYKRSHPRDLGQRTRSKRSLPRVPDQFKIGILKKQHLEVDEDYWMHLKQVEMSHKTQEKRPIVKFDGIELPNEREEHNAPDQHEIFGIGEPVVKIFNGNSKIEETRRNLFDAEVMKEKPNTWYKNSKKYQTQGEKYQKDTKKSWILKEDVVEVEESGRSKRSAEQANFTRSEVLDDDGDVLLEWDPSDEEIVTFRVTAKTLGYVGIGFNDKSHMKGADILIAWVVDYTGSVVLLVRTSFPFFYQKFSYDITNRPTCFLGLSNFLAKNLRLFCYSYYYFRCVIFVWEFIIKKLTVISILVAIYHYQLYFILINPRETHWVNLTHTSTLVENVFKAA